MDSRRQTILAFLKTHGHASLGEIAAHLEVSKQGALRHLETLEAAGWLDYEGTPITPSGRVTERIRRLTYGTLEIQITVDDPKAYTKPWTVTLQQRLMPDAELIEFVCQENNRSEGHLVGR